MKRLALAAVLAVAAFVVALWLEHRSAVELPAPTGPFAVGRAIFDWKDADREVLAWVWYPAENGGVVDDYIPRSLRAPDGGANLFTLLTHDLSKVRAHSLRDAGLSPRQRQYPVVIFRGGASAEVRNYSTLTEDLASHGYVVVGIDAPGRTGLVVFPDGRVVGRAPENNPETFSAAERDRGFNRLLAAWDADIAFALDRLATLDGKFAGRLDMNRVGVFGHSFGGAQAAQFCADDARCKAGVDVDGLLLGDVVAKGIHKPFMFLLSDHSRENDAESRKVKADIQSVYARLPPDARRIVVIAGANHFMFSDDGAVLKSRVLRGVMRLVGVLKIDARRQLAITAQEIRGFFDAHLKL